MSKCTEILLLAKVIQKAVRPFYLWWSYIVSPSRVSTSACWAHGARWQNTTLQIALNCAVLCDMFGYSNANGEIRPHIASGRSFPFVQVTIEGASEDLFTFPFYLRSWTGELRKFLEKSCCEAHG